MHLSRLHYHAIFPSPSYIDRWLNLRSSCLRVIWLWRNKCERPTILFIVLFAFIAIIGNKSIKSIYGRFQRPMAAKIKSGPWRPSGFEESPTAVCRHFTAFYDRPAKGWCDFEQTICVLHNVLLIEIACSFETTAQRVRVYYWTVFGKKRSLYFPLALFAYLANICIIVYRVLDTNCIAILAWSRPTPPPLECCVRKIISSIIIATIFLRSTTGHIWHLV